jgi:hypothetical protein
MYSMSAVSLSIDLGQSSAFTTDPNLTVARNSRLLGPLGLKINPPLYLSSRPTNNAFSVTARTSAAVPIVPVELQNYVLMLHFEKIK